MLVTILDKTYNIAPRTIVKGIAGWGAGACVGFVVKQIIDHNTEPQGRLQGFEKYVGSAAIGMVVKDAVQKALDERIDLIADSYKHTVMDSELRKMVEEENGAEG